MSFISGDVKIGSIAQLRNVTNIELKQFKTFYCDESDKEGFWEYDPNDTTSADNLGTIIVTTSGARLKRVINDEYIYPEWFGAVGDGIHDDTAYIQNTFNVSACVKFKSNSTYKITDTIVISKTVVNIKFGNNVRINSLQSASSTKAIFNFFSNIDKFDIDGNNATISYQNSPTIRTEHLMFIRGNSLKNINICNLNLINSANMGIAIFAGNSNTIVDTQNINVNINNIKLYNFLGDGIHIENFHKNVNIYNIYAMDVKDDIVAIINYDGTDVNAGKHYSYTSDVTIDNIKSDGTVTSIISLAGTNNFYVNNIIGNAQSSGIALKLVHAEGYTQPNINGFVNNVNVDGFLKTIALDTPTGGTQYNKNIVFRDIKGTNITNSNIYCSNQNASDTSLISNIKFINVQISSSNSNDSNIYLSNCSNISLIDVVSSGNKTSLLASNIDSLYVDNFKAYGFPSGSQYGFIVNLSKCNLGNILINDDKISPDLQYGFYLGDNTFIEYFGNLVAKNVTTKYSINGTIKGNKGYFFDVENVDEGVIIKHEGQNSLSWKGNNNYTSTLNASGNSANRTYNLPNASGDIIVFNNTTKSISATSDTLIIDERIAGGTNQSVYYIAKPTGSGGFLLNSLTNYQFTVNSGFNEVARLTNSGNFLLNRTSDNGNKLQIEGDIYISGKLKISTSGSAPSTGIATLISGSVVVPTGAIGTLSGVNLTVQETGQYNGRIRVSARTSGSNFTISSTDNTDNCTVAWQIIN